MCLSANQTSVDAGLPDNEAGRGVELAEPMISALHFHLPRTLLPGVPGLPRPPKEDGGQHVAQGFPGMS
jgi:hypothetical protein